MYDSWYLDQYDQYSDLFYDDFEIFGLQSQTLGTRLGQLESLDAEDVLEWIEDLEHDKLMPGYGHLKLMLTRHKRHQQHEIKPWYMAFQKDTFRKICNAFKLPSDYLFIRKNAAGCGAYKKHTFFNEQGSISQIGFTIRVPHSPRNNAKAIWSLSTSWNVSTGHTTALFEGVSDADIHDVQQYLRAKEQLTSHPLLLPTMVLELINTFFIDHRRELERSLFVLELQLLITRGRRNTDLWDWDYELRRESIKRCNNIYTGLVYFERRIEFTIGLSQFLVECLDSFEKEGLVIADEQQNRKLLVASKMIKETVVNNLNFAKSSLSQTLCLQKRCQGLTMVIYTVIAQQDSKTNVKIARAAKRDSSSMTAIAVLGIVFLPAMLVATMFSMSMFNFSATSSAGKTPSYVTSNFWMYWAVTIPLTLVVLVVWRLWMSFQRRRSAEGESLKRGKLTAVQIMHDTNLALNTPFYPGKG